MIWVVWVLAHYAIVVSAGRWRPFRDWSPALEKLVAFYVTVVVEDP